MQEINKLNPMDEMDIRAIGNSRVTRAEGNKQIYWTIGAMLVMTAGIFVGRSNSVAGWGLLIAGAVVAVYYMNSLSNKQKSVVSNLLSQWRESQPK